MADATEIFLIKTCFRNFAIPCQLTNIRHGRQSVSERLRMVKVGSVYMKYFQHEHDCKENFVFTNIKIMTAGRM